jgi:hypothetical protein
VSRKTQSIFCKTICRGLEGAVSSGHGGNAAAGSGFAVAGFCGFGFAGGGLGGSTISTTGFSSALTGIGGGTVQAASNIIRNSALIVAAFVP